MFPEEKVEVIYNWSLENSIARMKRNEALAADLGISGKFNIVFAGTMGRAQGLETVISAAEKLRDKVPDVQIVLAGGRGGVQQTEADGIRKRTVKSPVPALAPGQ